MIDEQEDLMIENYDTDMRRLAFLLGGLAIFLVVMWLAALSFAGVE